MRYSVILIACMLLSVGASVNNAALAHDLGDGAHITTLISADGTANADRPADDAAAQHSPVQNQWTLDITVQELAGQFPEYDIDENGKLTPMEYGAIDARQVVNYVLPRLNIRNQNGACATDITSYTIESHRRADYIRFPVQVDCPGETHLFVVDYALFFDENPYHQGTWTVVYQQQPVIQYFWPNERRREFRVKSQTSVGVLLNFIVKGIHHIAIGYDHILFLLSLLLPAVLVRQAKQWQPAESGRYALWNVTKIVTVFTLAHSVTLSLAVLRLVPLPPAVWVESIIALSIVIMAIHNIRPLFRFDVLLITFGFGLVHGFGFANVLLDYPLSEQALVVSLVAFNLGVELGQLAIALVVTPILFYCRYAAWYRELFVPLGSGVIGLVGVYWLVERLAG
ncbi:MAG: HupE/UreJ family protein [Ketobacteraceae bacterium]|nr:HupE/UreJ family protein [Ketobacteraceae bacterium]